MTLDFSRCRDVWVPDEEHEAGGFWSPPPPHVKLGVQTIIDHPYLLLADEMGLMKTAQSIIAAQFLHDMGVIDRVIVVAPASVRPKVWFDEDLGQLREQLWNDKHNLVSEYHQGIRQWSMGPKEQPALKWIVTNYEFIRKLRNLMPLFQYCGPKTLLILDESNAVRVWDSQQTQACMALRWLTTKAMRPIFGWPRCGRILEMNGTPVAETPMDVFSQANLLHPSILDCKFVTHFKMRYGVETIVRHTGGQPMLNPKTGKPLTVIDSWKNLPDLQQRMAPYVLRREAKDHGIDFALPPVGLTVELTDKTWRHYVSMRDQMIVWLEKNRAATSATVAVKTIRLAQITSGFLGGIADTGLDLDLWDAGGYDDGRAGSVDNSAVGEDDRAVRLVPEEAGTGVRAAGDYREGVDGGPQYARYRPPNGIQEIGREKLDFAIDWHKELLERYPNLKLLTWCRFVPELHRYLMEVSKLGHPIGSACGQPLLGGRLKDERDYALRLLHPKSAPEGPATVGATQGTGALGLNFTACRTVLELSYDFSPWKKRQSDARVNRPGQTGMVSFFYLIAIGPKGQKTIDHHIMMQRLGKMQINDMTVAAWIQKLKEE